MTQYKYKDQTFTVDDSKGCYAEVTLAEQTAYVGVNLQGGTNGNPYTFTVSERNVIDDGISRGTSGNFPTPDAALDGACNHLLQLHEQYQAHQAFDQKKACENLHDFVKGMNQEDSD